MIFILSGGIPSVATFVSVPEEVSQEAAPPLSSIAAGPTSGISGAESAPLAAEAPQGPSGFGNYSTSDGANPEDFVSINSPNTSSNGVASGSSTSTGTAG